MDENGYYDYLRRRRYLPELKDQPKYTPIVQYVSENTNPWARKLSDALDGFSYTVSTVDEMHEWEINVYQKFDCYVEDARHMVTIRIPDDSSSDNRTEEKTISMSFDSVMGWGEGSS